MEYSAIHHDMDKKYCYAIGKNCFLFRIQTKKGDIRKLILHYQDKYIPVSRMDTRKQVDMQIAASDLYHDYYEVVIEFEVVCLRYFFELTDNDGTVSYYGNYEFHEEIITDIDKMFDCPQNLREEEQFLIPDWAKNKVVYQIFPSRFATDRQVEESLWYKAPIDFRDDLKGNLRGIIEHFDHIKQLGIDVIYMTPIFRSDSCHKYDTIDYYMIDPSFGTKEDLKELVELAHQNGVRVILDAVFNHTSPLFFAFADIVEKQSNSAYLDWYFIEGFPLRAKWGEKPNYKSFGYFGGMPKLNLKNPEVETYVIDVAKYWIRECNIDGWRMDVGDEISHRFWKHFREEIKREKPDALIIGEIWHYAGDFLEGDEWDTVMNYQFYNAVMDLLAGESMTASQFLQTLDFMKGNIHSAVYPVLWNLIDSHDTARFLHSCRNSKPKQRLAAAFQLLTEGMPMIYYGDEYSIKGGKDPDCRRGMLWDEEYQDQKTYLWYQALIRARKEHPCILEGKVISTKVDDELGLIEIVRRNEEETLTIIYHCKAGRIDRTEYAGKYNLLTQKVCRGSIGAYEAFVLQEVTNH